MTRRNAPARSHGHAPARSHGNATAPTHGHAPARSHGNGTAPTHGHAPARSHGNATAPAPTPAPGRGLNGGAIAGIVLGGVAVIGAICFGIWLCRRCLRLRRQRRAGPRHIRHSVQAPRQESGRQSGAGFSSPSKDLDDLLDYVRRSQGDLERGQSSAPPDDLLVLRRDVSLHLGGESPDITEVEQEQRGGRLPPAALERGRDVVTSPAGLQLGVAPSAEASLQLGAFAPSAEAVLQLAVVAPSERASLQRTHSWPMGVGRSFEATLPAPGIPPASISARFVESEFYPGGTPEWVHCQSAETSRAAGASAGEE